MLASIFGFSGEKLTADDRDFFKDADPVGYILFRRNCSSKAQLRALTDTLRDLHGRDDVPVLIDQEGGRVARMQPPDWPKFPSAERFADLYRVSPISAIEAARANAGAIAVTLKECGINVDCMPLLDVRHPSAHDVIGDRALGAEPMQVAALGRAVIEGLRGGGVVAVVKHVPGHGRSMGDSHVELPVVSASEEDLEVDLEPFRTLNWAPMAMAAHVVYTAWDAARPASLSPTVIGDIVRGRIGFDGWLMSDDVGMQALTCGFEERGRRVLEAGCDVALHCSGDLAEMVEVARGAKAMTPKGHERLERAMATIASAGDASPYEELAARRDALLAYA
jgi:beta-N-acetylhexosaminidase